MEVRTLRRCAPIARPCSRLLEAEQRVNPRLEREIVSLTEEVKPALRQRREQVSTHSGSGFKASAWGSSTGEADDRSQNSDQTRSHERPLLHCASCCLFLSSKSPHPPIIDSSAQHPHDRCLRHSRSPALMHTLLACLVSPFASRVPGLNSQAHRPEDKESKKSQRRRQMHGKVKVRSRRWETHGSGELDMLSNAEYITDSSRTRSTQFPSPVPPLRLPRRAQQSRMLRPGHLTRKWSPPSTAHTAP